MITSIVCFSEISTFNFYIFKSAFLYLKKNVVPDSIMRFEMTKTLGLLCSNRDGKGTTVTANSDSNSWHCQQQTCANFMESRKENRALKVSELIPPALLVPSLVVQPAECWHVALSHHPHWAQDHHQSMCQLKKIKKVTSHTPPWPHWQCHQKPLQFPPSPPSMILPPQLPTVNCPISSCNARLVMPMHKKVS